MDRLPNYETLFDSQLGTLRERECPRSIVALLANQRSSVLERASEMIVRAGLITFIPVVPVTYSTVYDQMTMVRNRDKVGYTDLEPTLIRDLIKVPKEPYFIFNVEDGEAALGKNQEDATRALRSVKRSALTVAEAIALCAHTDVLSQHSVVALNSRYGGKWWANDILAISIGSGGSPVIKWFPASCLHWGGIPSCGSRSR